VEIKHILVLARKISQLNTNVKMFSDTANSLLKTPTQAKIYNIHATHLT